MYYSAVINSVTEGARFIVAGNYFPYYICHLYLLLIKIG